MGEDPRGSTMPRGHPLEPGSVFTSASSAAASPGGRARRGCGPRPRHPPVPCRARGEARSRSGPSAAGCAALPSCRGKGSLGAEGPGGLEQRGAHCWPGNRPGRPVPASGRVGRRGAERPNRAESPGARGQGAGPRGHAAGRVGGATEARLELAGSGAGRWERWSPGSLPVHGSLAQI